jgi:ribosomal protein L24E
LDPDYELQKPEDAPHNERGVPMFMSEQRGVYRILVDSVDGAILSHELCQDGFVNANYLAIDSEGGVIVADNLASELLYINSDCSAKHIIIPQFHEIAIPYDVEILHGHGIMVVASSGLARIYYVEVDSNKRLVGYADTGATNQLAHGLSQCVDQFGNDGFLFIEQGNRIVFFDIGTQQRTVIIDQPSGVVDIHDLEYAPCGIFFTANDNNEVWFCSETDGSQTNPLSRCNLAPSTCRRLCDPLTDASSCQYLMNPSGLAVDCTCKLYAGNKGNGNFVMYDAGSSSGQYLGNGYFAQDLEIYGPLTCGDDLTPPVGSVCEQSNNPIASTDAGAGDIITVSVTLSEPCFKPTIECSIDGGAPFTLTVPGNDFQTSYQATYTVSGGDPVGSFECAIGSITDAAGNVGSVSADASPSCQVTIGFSASPTPSPSLNPSPSVSPSITPSPTDLPVQIQVEMFFESGECATQGCVDGDARDNTTIRTSSLVSRVRDWEITDLANCGSQGGTPSVISATESYCIFPIDFNDLTKWAISDFDLYRLFSSGLPPDWYRTPSIKGPGEYPNTISSTSSRNAVAAAVDCATMPSAAPLRWVWERPQQGPCYQDTEFNVEMCSPAGKSLSNNLYGNAGGETLPSDAIFKDVFCPT